MKSTRGLEIPTSLGELVDPARIALVVYDMQVGIRRQIAGGDKTVVKVHRVLEAARAAGVRSVFTRHLSLPKALMGRMQFRTAMTWQRTEDPEAVTPWLLRDSPGIAMEIGIEPTARHAADLGFVPVVISDACGAGHPEAAERSLEALRVAGDSVITDVEAFCSLLSGAG